MAFSKHNSPRDRVTSGAYPEKVRLRPTPSHGGPPDRSGYTVADLRLVSCLAHFCGLVPIQSPCPDTTNYGSHSSLRLRSYTIVKVSQPFSTLFPAGKWEMLANYSLMVFGSEGFLYFFWLLSAIEFRVACGILVFPKN